MMVKEEPGNLDNVTLAIKWRGGWLFVMMQRKTESRGREVTWYGARSDTG